MNPKTRLALLLTTALGAEQGMLWKPKKFKPGKNPESPALKMAERKRQMRAEKLKNQLKKD